MNRVHFQSSDKEWETPNDLFQPLKEEFNIVLDSCATALNTKCKAYFDKKMNAFTSSWGLAKEIDPTGSVWMNPPYGRGVDRWIHKAFEEALNGVTTVALLPARTDTSWFHNYIYNKHEVRFLKGRVKFVDASASAPFPSMIVIFKPNKVNKFKSVWKKLKW